MGNVSAPHSRVGSQELTQRGGYVCILGYLKQVFIEGTVCKMLIYNPGLWVITTKDVV